MAGRLEMSCLGLPVELARVIQTLLDGAPPRPLPLAVTRAQWDVMVTCGEVEQVDAMDERAWLAGIVIQIVGDKV
jgi:hypothetical protein